MQSRDSNNFTWISFFLAYEQCLPVLFFGKMLTLSVSVTASG